MTDLNPSTPQTGVMQPRMQLIAGGNLVSALLSCQVTQNGFFRANTWRAEILPSQDTTIPLDFWMPKQTGDTTGADKINITIQSCDTQSGTAWSTLIAGKVDDAEYDPFTGVLSISGRDVIGNLIDNKNFTVYMNRPSSAIISDLAKQAGITANVTATSGLAGRYYGIDHTKVTQDNFARGRSLWDLMVELAQNESMDLWIDYSTGQPVLNFGPNPDAKSPAWVVNVDQGDTISSNVQQLKFTQNKVAKDIRVIVRSWDSQHAAGYEVGYGASQSAVDSGKAIQYIFRFPNLNHDQAQKKARGVFQDLARHETTVSVGWPYMTTLTPRDVLRVQGISDGLDRIYFLSSIDRSYSIDGYSETLKARNLTPTEAGIAGFD